MTVPEYNPADINRIWRQKRIPVVVRSGKPKQGLRLRLPYAEDNRQWLRNGRRTDPSWNDAKAYWEIPKKWFNDFVDRALARYGRLYVIQPHREQEICAPACWNARGHECECSCLGAHHGTGREAGGSRSRKLSPRAGTTSTWPAG